MPTSNSKLTPRCFYHSNRPLPTAHATGVFALITLEGKIGQALQIPLGWSSFRFSVFLGFWCYLVAVHAPSCFLFLLIYDGLLQNYPFEKIGHVLWLWCNAARKLAVYCQCPLKFWGTCQNLRPILSHWNSENELEARSFSSTSPKIESPSSLVHVS